MISGCQERPEIILSGAKGSRCGNTRGRRVRAIASAARDPMAFRGSPEGHGVHPGRHGSDEGRLQPSMETRNETLRRAELVAVGAALVRRGLIRGREGNLSCRLDARTILVSPRGTDKGRLTAPELVRCRLDEPPVARASSEALTHLAVYRRCPAAQALVHAHPRDLLALSARGLLPDPGLLDEGLAVVPRIENVPPLPPGSERLAEACADALARAPVAVVRRHGVFCSGVDIWEALQRVEVVELLAGITLSETWRGAEI